MKEPRAEGGVAGKSAAMMGEPRRGRGAVRGPHARPPWSDETSGEFLPALPTSPLALSSSPLPPSRSATAYPEDMTSLSLSLSTVLSLYLYLYLSLSLYSSALCRLSCLLASVSRVSCVSQPLASCTSLCVSPLCPPISLPMATPSLISRTSLSPAPPLVSYTALSVVCGSHASISIALRASCLAYRVSVSRLSCFLCLPVSRLSYLPSHALSWAHPHLHPACLVMSDDLSLHPCLPPRSSVWFRLPPAPSRCVTRNP